MIQIPEEEGPPIFVSVEDKVVPFRSKGGLGVEVETTHGRLAVVRFHLDQTDENRELVMAWMDRPPRKLVAGWDGVSEITLKGPVYVRVCASFHTTEIDITADGKREVSYFQVECHGEGSWTQ